MTTLDQVRTTLPTSWYFDPEHYALELGAIWYRDWICVGRAELLQRDGDFIVVDIGTQSVVVTRLPDGAFNAFHNTCRHRGSQLCQGTAGHFRNGRIVCPYHTWTYATDGSLLSTPGRLECDDFDPDNFSLYAVHTATWRGFIFINLSESPELPLADFLGDEAETLHNWPLEEMHSVHQETITVACNWKIFWENYSECYHCPRIHPELCKVMPVYRKGVLSPADLPGWQPQFEGDVGRTAVGNSARTWTLSGAITLPQITGPTQDEIAAGVAFSSFCASMYVVAHPDYVRSVRLKPTGPESVELTVDWLLPSDHEVQDKQALEPIFELSRLVIHQDGEICELNQLGLHSKRHKTGVLMPQEYCLWHFHESVRHKLADARRSRDT